MLFNRKWQAFDEFKNSAFDKNFEELQLHLQQSYLTSMEINKIYFYKNIISSQPYHPFS